MTGLISALLMGMLGLIGELKKKEHPTDGACVFLVATLPQSSAMTNASPSTTKIFVSTKEVRSIRHWICLMGAGP